MSSPLSTAAIESMKPCLKFGELLRFRYLVVFLIPIQTYLGIWAVQQRVEPVPSVSGLSRMCLIPGTRSLT